MSPEAMTPKAALTRALDRAIKAGLAAGVPWPVSHPSLAAASLARSVLEHLPKGWELVNAAAIHRELQEIDEKLNESGSTITLLLAFRIQQDGHAKTLGEAHRIAQDLDRVRGLYPDMWP